MPTPGIPGDRCTHEGVEYMLVENPSIPGNCTGCALFNPDADWPQSSMRHPACPQLMNDNSLSLNCINPQATSNKLRFLHFAWVGGLKIKKKTNTKGLALPLPK